MFLISIKKVALSLCQRCERDARAPGVPGTDRAGAAHQVRPRPRRVDASGGRRWRYAQRQPGHAARSRNLHGLSSAPVLRERFAHRRARPRRRLRRRSSKTIAKIDPGIPLKVRTLEQFHSDAVALPRFRTLLLIVFAGLAAALATAGVYGVMSYVAAQRQAEMGVRIALGATGGDVVSILVGSAARLAAIGLVCGLAIALAAGRFIESMLYGIRPQDPRVLSGAVLLLSGATLLAALIPALRAARLDPASALRQE